MQDFFGRESNDSIETLLGQARNVALNALKEYDLPWQRIRFIQLSDTITYKIETGTAQSYLMRIHSDRLSKEEIHSELVLLNALNQRDHITVPEGITSLQGSNVLEMETDGGHRPVYVTMMKWVEGEHADGELNEAEVLAMGSMVARLHEAARYVVPASDFVRPIWGKASFKRELAKLERHYTRFLSTDEWKLYQAAAGKIFTQLAVMQPNNQRYGLIHGDLHTGNIVWKDGQPYPIDFGRCGYGYYLYDMANTLVGLYPKMRQVFISGYELVKKLETDCTRELECLFMMCMIENYCHHASDPRETEGLMAEQPYAQALIKAYLNEQPFLFQAIEPLIQ